ncbi:hypothetical protein RKE29_10310, partial [Streptomyces sp. B1866]|nr:hypothetical protein [Streptomyces sp. B1866]
MSKLPQWVGGLGASLVRLAERLDRKAAEAAEAYEAHDVPQGYEGSEGYGAEPGVRAHDAGEPVGAPGEAAERPRAAAPAPAGELREDPGSGDEDGKPARGGRRAAPAEATTPGEAAGP